MNANNFLPEDNSYLEVDLPDFLKESIAMMEKSWQTLDNGGTDLRWDAYWCNLMADINSSEVDQIISPRQADYLRKKYLRMDNSI